MIGPEHGLLGWRYWRAYFLWACPRAPEPLPAPPPADDPGPNVVPFPPSAILQPTTMLRKLADDIDAGRYGEVGCVAVAMLADRLEVFAGGLDSDGPSAANVLHAGFLKLNMQLLDHGDE